LSPSGVMARSRVRVPRNSSSRLLKSRNMVVPPSWRVGTDRAAAVNAAYQNQSRRRIDGKSGGVAGWRLSQPVFPELAVQRPLADPQELGRLLAVAAGQAQRLSDRA